MRGVSGSVRFFEHSSISRDYSFNDEMLLFVNSYMVILITKRITTDGFLQVHQYMFIYVLLHLGIGDWEVPSFINQSPVRTEESQVTDTLDMYQYTREPRCKLNSSLWLYSTAG